MKLAILSGKGGTGKTFLSVNLCAAAERATYLDCDVEEPNGRLFLKPEGVERNEVHTLRPVFRGENCTGCRKCVDFCHFNALVFLKGKPMVFPDVCHACGGCSLVCPADAVTEEKRLAGSVEQGTARNVRVVSGCMEMGESSGIPVIQAVLERSGAPEELTVIDCPPGSACSVLESVEGADACLLVAEPTAFGFHNFQMVHELVRLLGKPCGVVVNKAAEPYPPLEDFCREQGTPILCRIPYDETLAALGARAEVAAWADERYAERFRSLLRDVKEVLL